MNFIHFEKGEDRFVVVFPSLKVALKFPRIHLFTGVMSLYRHVKRGNWNDLVFAWQMSIDVPMLGYKRLLFRGLVVNWREFVFYRRAQHPFLQPTYVSFFGLMNVQRADEMLVADKKLFWRQMREITNDRVYDDPHHFENPDNFCLNEGTLRILDYGSLRTYKVVIRCGKKICEHFSLDGS